MLLWFVGVEVILAALEVLLQRRIADFPVTIITLVRDVVRGLAAVPGREEVIPAGKGKELAFQP